MFDPRLKRVVVTGANGFIGRALCARLHADGFLVRAVVRKLSPSLNLPQGIEIVQIGTIGPDTEWTEIMNGVDSVIHLAARAHVIRDITNDPLFEFRRVNTRGTERMALMAAETGVRRFVFVSSIGVNGENTGINAFKESDDVSPHSPYAISKWEAECALQKAAGAGLETVVVRPPLVYGPAVPGNFLRLLQIVKRGIPLPFGSVQNRRSFIYLGNLTDALVACVRHTNAARELFLVSDGQDISTSDLIRKIAYDMGKTARLIPCPSSILYAAGSVIGRGSDVHKTIDSLCVDSSKIRRQLGWVPPFTMDEGIRETVAWFQRF